MRPERSPLDLNHLPQDLTTSASGQRRSRRRGDEDNESSRNSKMYECRFCSLKFCKSQALGGHMNRHRHEREAETLDKARQLVYSTDQNLVSYVTAGALHQHNPSDHHQVYQSTPYVYESTATLPHFDAHCFMGHGHDLTGSSATSPDLYSDPFTCNGASIQVNGPGPNQWGEAGFMGL